MERRLRKLLESYEERELLAIMCEEGWAANGYGIKQDLIEHIVRHYDQLSANCEIVRMLHPVDEMEKIQKYRRHQEHIEQIISLHQHQCSMQEFMKMQRALIMEYTENDHDPQKCLTWVQNHAAKFATLVKEERFRDLETIKKMLYTDQ